MPKTNDLDEKIQRLIKAARTVNKLSWVVSPSWGSAKKADQWHTAIDKLDEILKEMK